MLDPEKVRRGKPIRGSIFDRIFSILHSLEIITEEGSGLGSERTEAGTSIWIDESREFPVRITSRTGAKYAWTGVKATTAGGWEDIPELVGTVDRDWAIEENGQVAVTPQIVWVRREEWTHVLVFGRDNCT